MKTSKYFSIAIQFFKSLNTRTKENAAGKANFESTNTRLGIDLNHSSLISGTKESLLFQMYSEENEALFI